MKWTDASRLETYQLCPRRYYFKYEKRLIPKDHPPNASAVFGLGIHAAMDTIYSGDFAEYVPCSHSAPLVPETEFCIYCQPNQGQIRKMFEKFLVLFPPGLEVRVYTQHLGLLLITRYIEKWRNDPVKEGTFGVEATFSVSLGGIPYVGRIDLLTIWDRVKYVIDHKTKSRITDNFVRGFKLDAKMTGYMWAVSELLQEPVHKSLINTILVANNITPNSFARFETSRTPSDIQQWQDNALALLDDLTRDKDRDFFPLDSQACFSYNRECEFYRICTATANPDGAIAQFYDVKPESDFPHGLGKEDDE
jgi:PD-(D/E)XK nuclease superfamily